MEFSAKYLPGQTLYTFERIEKKRRNLDGSHSPTTESKDILERIRNIVGLILHEPLGDKLIGRELRGRYARHGPMVYSSKLV